MGNYETDVDVEVKRLQAHVTRLGDEVERWRQACRLDTPDDLVGALAEYARTLEETRDQAKTATREAEQLRVRLLPGDRGAVHALETLNRCRQDLDTAVREREAAQDQCGREQNAANEFALMLDAFAKAVREYIDPPHPGSVNDFGPVREALKKYDASIRTDAPPPVDWKAKYERAEADCAALVALVRNAKNIHAASCDTDDNDGPDCSCGARAVIFVSQPGAALLERLRAAEADAVMGRQLATMLSVYAGEGGRNEGAVDVLGRKLAQLRAAVAVVEAARRLSEENENVISEHLPDTWEDADAMVDHALAAYDALGAKGEAVEP